MARHLVPKHGEYFVGKGTQSAESRLAHDGCPGTRVLIKKQEGQWVMVWEWVSLHHHQEERQLEEGSSSTAQRRKTKSSTEASSRQHGIAGWSGVWVVVPLNTPAKDHHEELDVLEAARRRDAPEDAQCGTNFGLSKVV